MKKKIKKITLVLLACSLLLAGTFKQEKSKHDAAVVSSTVIAAAVAALTVAVGGALAYPGVTDNIRGGISNASTAIWNRLNATIPLTTQKEIESDLLQGILTQNSLTTLLNSYKKMTGSQSQGTYYDPINGMFTTKQVSSVFKLFRNNDANTATLITEQLKHLFPDIKDWAILSPYYSAIAIRSVFGGRLFNLNPEEVKDVKIEIVNINAETANVKKWGRVIPYYGISLTEVAKVSPATSIVSVKITGLPDRLNGSKVDTVDSMSGYDTTFEDTRVWWTSYEIKNNTLYVPFTYRNANGLKIAWSPEVINSIPIPQGTITLDSPNFPTQEEINQNIRDMIIASGAMAGSIALPQNPTFPNADSKDRVESPGDIATPEEWAAAKERVGDLTPDDVIIGGVIGSLLLPFPEFPDLKNNFPDSWSIGEMFKGLFTGLGDILGWLGAIISTGFINLTNLLKSVPLILSDMFTWLKNLTFVNRIINAITGLATSIGAAVSTAISSAFEGLKDILISLFVPGELFFEEKVLPLRLLFAEKFAFFYSLGSIIPKSVAETQVLTLPFIMGAEIDFSWYAEHRLYLHRIMSAFIVMNTIFATLRRFRPQYVING